MRAYAQFITTPTADTIGTALLLHFDNKRYLLGNVSEGTQRACVQVGTKLLKVSDIYMTGKMEWNNSGGLIGMILTLADSIASSVEQAKKSGKKVDRPRLRICSAPNLNHTLATARRFVFRKGLPLEAIEVKHEYQKKSSITGSGIPPTWEDNNLRIWAIPLIPSGGGAKSPKKRSFDEHEGIVDQSNVQESERQQEERHAQMRKAVVADMFDSDWRLDALHETPLSEVQLPAAIFVRDTAAKQFVKYTGPIPGGQEPVPDIKVWVRKPWPGAMVVDLPPTQPAEESVCYIFRCHPQRGKFRPDRAKALKVPKGTLWGKLTSGESVQNEAGETITPEMVLDAGKAGGGFVVLDVPSEKYLDSLESREEWASEEVMEGVGAFLWILGPGVAGSPKFESFVSKMGHLKHIISSSDVCPNRLAMDNAAMSTARLRQIDPDRYEIPVHDNTTVPQSTYTTLNPSEVRLPPNVIAAKRGMKVQIEPTIEIQEEEVVSLVDFTTVEKQTPKEVLAKAQMAKEALQQETERNDGSWIVPNPNAEFIALGTGSALPSKYRNVSATLVRVPGYGSYLLDCGENTLGQLQRVYNPAQLTELLRDLRGIWISHMHADHHLGTVSVIKAWYEVVHSSQPLSTPPSPSYLNTDYASMTPTLAVISDIAMIRWLAEYSQVEDYGFSRILPLSISTANPIAANTDPKKFDWNSSNPEANWQARSTLLPYSTGLGTPHLEPSRYPHLLGFSDIQAVAVNHCLGAKAVVVTFPDGFKVAYSGDCRPSNNFARIGKGVTVLVHEATFDDELGGDARAKKHSTTSEALDIGSKMGAKAVLLTHFSQRYQKLPKLEVVEEGDNEITEMELAEDEGSGNVDAEEDFAPPDQPVTAVAETAENLTAQEVSAPKEQVIKVRNKDMKVAVAFDFMRLKAKDFPQMDKFTPALVELLATEEQ